MAYHITTIDKIFWLIGVIASLGAIVIALAFLVAIYEVRKEQKSYCKGKDIRDWIILLPLLFIFSCSPTNTHFTRLKESGTYTVATRAGNQTTFKEVAGKYAIADDTLKPGDKIAITVITNRKR